jgi:hypothetical protein
MRDFCATLSGVNFACEADAENGIVAATSRHHGDFEVSVFPGNGLDAASASGAFPPASAGGSMPATRSGARRQPQPNPKSPADVPIRRTTWSAAASRGPSRRAIASSSREAPPPNRWRGALA